MKRFIYHECFKSKKAVEMRYFHKVLSLSKMKIFCKDEKKKQRLCNRISSLKKTFRQKEYPQYFTDYPDGRVAVYTAVFGDYDKIKPVGIKSPLCDYYLITDQAVDERLGWTILKDALPEEEKNKSNAMKNRYCKMHPEILFPQYEYSLYLDGTMEPKYDLFPLLGRMGEHFLGMYRHIVRDCIYEEAKTVIRIGKAGKEEVNNLMESYRAEGFPEHYGLTAGGIILRRHHSEECKKIMNEWWDMYRNGPKRDQLSLMYCLWKNGYTLADVADLGIAYEIDPRLVSEAHRKR